MSAATWTELTPVPADHGVWLAPLMGRWGTVGAVVGLGFEAAVVVPHRAEHASGGPSGGSLDPSSADALRAVLASEPELAGQHWVAALWEGCGELGGGATLTPSGWRRDAFLLPDSVVEAPRLELPHRSYLCFQATVAELAPLRFDEGVPGTQSPNLFWPRSRRCLVATEVDLVATFVGGWAALVERVVDEVPGARRVETTAPLAPWDELTAQAEGGGQGAGPG